VGHKVGHLGTDIFDKHTFPRNPLKISVEFMRPSDRRRLLRIWGLRR
jgi:hypothetical protein